ncbi:MAG TPA: phage tail sheath C-terminal domain-containing protein [Blastocatellia bacterium]|nr:phage tail sheath C-terminal domain-containing protein [Blastocatellia bacterium]
MPVRIQLGAPGIYRGADSGERAISGVRMDVCAFAGVAPRGPARTPVIDEQWRDDRPCVEPERPRRRTVPALVESFDEYRRLFGGFEGPGLLPYAVASFFEQGGRRAYITRIVHEYGDAAKNAGGVAQGDVPGAGANVSPLRLRARDEGSWGNGLRAALNFTTRPLIFENHALDSLTVSDDEELPAGALLRLTLIDAERVLRFVANVMRQEREQRAGFIRVAVFDQLAPAEIKSVEVVEGVLTIDDSDGRTERHERLGFSSLHPRWMAIALCYESQLVYPDSDWSSGEMIPEDPKLPPGQWSALFEGGEDRYPDVTPDDFFDNAWTFGEDEPGNGVYALAQIPDLSLLVAPDLYSPSPIAAPEDIVGAASLAGPDFDSCFDLPEPEEQAMPQFDLEGLRLDPTLTNERGEIIRLQQKLVDFAEAARSFIVLLDVPPGLNQRQILNWRVNFNSAFAAAYHPWLQISRGDDSRDALIHLPPSAVAAGIIARQETAFGAWHGPANALAAEVIDLDDRVAPARHDELHTQGVNVYLRERDGIRLTAARTLSRDPAFRQLSVRRLLTMISRALYREMQWVVFEPNRPALRAELRLVLRGYLRRLFRLGAFRGANEEQAFFVRCDETNNPPFVIDAGRLIAEIGVAPSEPIEFIVLRLAREGDGMLVLEEK